MEIEIYSDVVCPWCYLGTARLMSALNSFEGDVVLRWRAFQLDPTAPCPGQPLIPWLARRFGGEVRARQSITRVSELATAEGLRLDFDRAVLANTFDAHRLLWFADQPEAVLFGATAQTQPDLALALHRAHFVSGLDISSPEVLVGIAAEHDLEPDRIERLLATREGTAEVRAQLARASDLGIDSVPTFIFAGRYAVTGAQEAATLRSVLDEVARRVGEVATVGAMVPAQRSAPAREDDSRVS